MTLNLFYTFIGSLLLIIKYFFIYDRFELAFITILFKINFYSCFTLSVFELWLLEKIIEMVTRWALLIEHLLIFLFIYHGGECYIFEFFLKIQLFKLVNSLFLFFLCKWIQQYLDYIYLCIWIIALHLSLSLVLSHHLGLIRNEWLILILYRLVYIFFQCFLLL